MPTPFGKLALCCKRSNKKCPHATGVQTAHNSLHQQCATKAAEEPEKIQAGRQSSTSPALVRQLLQR